MKGTRTRDFKLSSVRMTLSKLDAKYSKSSVLVDEEDSSDTDGDDLIKANISTSSFEPVEHVPQVESGLASKVLAEQDHHLRSLDSSEATRLKMQPASASEGSPPAEDETTFDTDSSIESVKTDSILGFTNVHSVSSLADSAPRSDKNEQRMSISLLTSVRKLQPESSSASAGINHVSVISNKGRKEPCNDTASSTSRLESIQEPTAQTLEKSKEYTIDPHQVELEFPTKEEPIGFQQSLSLTGNMCEQAVSNDGEHPTKNSVRIKSDQFTKNQVLHHCKCNEQLKLKRKSTAVQTQSLSHQDEQSFVFKKNSKGDLLETKYSDQDSPGFTATKLPLFLNDISATSKVGLGEGVRPEPSSFIENELSELVSHHLYLTKEFLKRQHRMYMANCRAVQLLEKGYKEKILQGI